MSGEGTKPPGHTPGKQKGKSVSTSRDMAVRLRTANKRTTSQQKWLERQLNDPYVARAKAEGWRSRAAYKLMEIDDKYNMLKPGQRLVDLGAAPGGWCQVAAKRIGSVEASPRVVGIDLLPIDPIAGVTLLEMDFMTPEADEKLREALGGRADGVMSDMAANTTGHKMTDHLKIVGLAEAAVAFAYQVLAPGGFFVCKLFQGGETVVLINELKRNFSVVRHVKPQSSRSGSSELYVLAMGYKGVKI
jgi:23S rRNA (uridine2552-2'-O)-methyltransferase